MSILFFKYRALLPDSTYRGRRERIEELSQSSLYPAAEYLKDLRAKVPSRRRISLEIIHVPFVRKKIGFLSVLSGEYTLVPEKNLSESARTARSLPSPIAD